MGCLELFIFENGQPMTTPPPKVYFWAFRLTVTWPPTPSRRRSPRSAACAARPLVAVTIFSVIWRKGVRGETFSSLQIAYYTSPQQPSPVPHRLSEGLWQETEEWATPPSPLQTRVPNQANLFNLLPEVLHSMATQATRQVSHRGAQGWRRRNSGWTCSRRRRRGWWAGGRRGWWRGWWRGLWRHLELATLKDW